MVRYRDDDSDSTRTLLIGAGVVAGLLAGAVVAHRLGGWRGMRRALAGRQGRLLAVLRAALPAGTLKAVLDAVGIEELLAGLLQGDRRRTRRARPLRRHEARRYDPDLDEYEVEDFERAAAGLDDEDDEDVLDLPMTARRARRTSDDALDEDEAFDEDDLGDEAVATADEEAGDEDADGEDPLDDEEDEIVDDGSPEAIEQAVLAAFRRHPVLRHRALEIAVDEDGVAELTGWVRRERDLRTARRVAAAVPGVTDVVVDVTVRDVVRVVPDARARGA